MAIMAITPIEFGKNLRPSTVDALNKINEIITVVNELQPSEIDELQQNVTALQEQMSTANGNISTLQGQMSTANGNISTLQTSVTNNTDDINDIKVTLYTPLKSTE